MKKSDDEDIPDMKSDEETNMYTPGMDPLKGPVKLTARQVAEWFPIHLVLIKRGFQEEQAMGLSEGLESTSHTCPGTSESATCPGTTQIDTGVIRHGRSRRDDGRSETAGPNREEKGGRGYSKSFRNQPSA
jgi:hypothetical protein